MGVELLKKVVAAEARYDVIVLDPPWENKSARRGNKYAPYSILCTLESVDPHTHVETHSPLPRSVRWIRHVVDNLHRL